MENIIKKLTAPILLIAVNIVMQYYYRNGLTEYNSVLDRYLNFYSIFIMIACIAIAVISAGVCIIFLIVRIIRLKKDTSKVFATIMLVIFLLVNVESHIALAAIQGKTEVINSVSDSDYSHVDFDALFANRDESTYHEQTALYTVTDEIPANYSIQQSDINGGVCTDCVKIADNELLELYYDELADKYADYGIIDFNSDEAEALGIRKGFHYTIDDFELHIIVVKENSVFNITVERKIAIDDVISKQIRAM